MLVFFLTARWHHHSFEDPCCRCFGPTTTIILAGYHIIFWISYLIFCSDTPLQSVFIRSLAYSFSSFSWPTLWKMPKVKRKSNKNRVHTIYPQEKPDKSKQKIVLKDGLRTDDAEFIDSKTSRKILEEARKQQNELEEEFGLHDPEEDRTRTNVGSKASTNQPISDDEVDEDFQDDYGVLDQNEESARDVYESFYEELKLDKQDERALEMFMAKDNLKRKTLSEYIRDKLKEKEEELNTMLNEEGLTTDDKNAGDLDQRVIDLYRGVKIVLQRYRSGPLPKAFKIIPALTNWEQVLYITEPDCWTAAAMFQATRLFASNLKERMAQRFFNLILMPRIRDDIEEHKRLNFHLYQSLRKALFKPGAFFKGIIIPLCESGDCTLREAVIIGSVIAKNHIPILHSCAAMLKIAEMDYSGANSIFLNILIQKKYALPFRVIDALFYHFYRFLNDRRSTLPVLWHQCLLAFVQNYKNDLSSEQKESLLELIRVQTHHAITPEIRKELFQSKNRDGSDFINEPMVDINDDNLQM